MIFIVLIYLLPIALNAQVTNEDTRAKDNAELRESLLDEQASQKEDRPITLEGDMEFMTLTRYIEAKKVEVKKGENTTKIPTKAKPLIPFEIAWVETSDDAYNQNPDKVIDEARCAMAIKQAIEEIEKKTCIQFKHYSNETNYISFTMNIVGAKADIGIEPGRQIVSLSVRSCYLGTVLHEILHTLGMMHESTRMDRDNYITINVSNIEDGMLKNFEKYPHLIGDDYPYDVDSIMHPPSTWFSKEDDGMESITPKNSFISSKRLGQRDGLSRLDVKKLISTFQCPPDEPSTTTTPSTTSFSKNQTSLPLSEGDDLLPEPENDMPTMPAPLTTQSTSISTTTQVSSNDASLPTAVTENSINTSPSNEGIQVPPGSDDSSKGGSDQPPLPVPLKENDKKFTNKNQNRKINNKTHKLKNQQRKKKRKNPKKINKEIKEKKKKTFDFSLSQAVI